MNSSTPKTRPSSPRTNPPVPVQPPFTFSSPEDTPSGASYKRTEDGFVASAPANSWLMAIVFGGISFALGSMLFNNFSVARGVDSFVVCIGIVFMVAFVFFAFFAFGREGVTIKGDKLYMTKTVLGIGLWQTMNWRKIMRAQVLSRTGMRGLGWVVVSQVSDQILELESDTHIRKMGTNLKAEHLYYLRYLIIEAVKESRKLPAVR